MTALREAANKMLKMLEEASLADPALAAEIIYKIGAALPSFRAALAQEQDAELSAALGWPGGISTPALDRKRLLQMVAALRVSAQQALEALEIDPDVDPIFAGETIVALRAALAQEQAEPLNLLDRAVQKRLAAQWGYVPAEQAEPAQEQAEPVAVVRWNDIGHISWRALVMLSDGTPLYTAPPRRTMVPLTEREIGKLTAMFDARHSVRVGIARAVEKASWEKNK